MITSLEPLVSDLVESIRMSLFVWSLVRCLIYSVFSFLISVVCRNTCLSLYAALSSCLSSYAVFSFLCRCVVARLFGCMVARLFGCLVVWLYCCLVVWFYGFMSSSTIVCECICSKHS